MAELDVEVVVAAQAALGEGPVWDDRAGQLVWVDILGHAVHRFDPGGQTVPSLDAGQAVGAAVPRAAGGLVLALCDGIALVDEGAAEVRLVVELERENGDTRMNDAKCDPAGRLWAGTMAWDARPAAGSLYRVDPDLSTARVLTGVAISNGLDWSPDCSAMYYVDTATHGIDVLDYDVESGVVANRRRLVEIDPADGIPDGMTVDAEGFLWVAMWDGWAVRRYTPSGVLDAVLPVPVSRPTSCAFGGPDHRDLYITSARGEPEEAELANQPHAGSLLRMRPGVQGRPANRFAA